MDLPVYPFNDGIGDEGWFEGMDLTLDDLEARWDEHVDGSPAERKAAYWDYLTDELDSEAEGLWSELSEAQQVHVKAIFDRLWTQRTRG